LPVHRTALGLNAKDHFCSSTTGRSVVYSVTIYVVNELDKVKENFLLSWTFPNKTL